MAIFVTEAFSLAFSFCPKDGIELYKFWAQTSTHGDLQSEHTVQ